LFSVHKKEASGFSDFARNWTSCRLERLFRGVTETLGGKALGLLFHTIFVIYPPNTVIKPASYRERFDLDLVAFLPVTDDFDG
jgi:hypothetical protein